MRGLIAVVTTPWATLNEIISSAAVVFAFVLWSEAPRHFRNVIKVTPAVSLAPRMAPG
jgi:hypothetical protein